MTPASTMPRPAGTEGHGGQQRADQRHEHRAGQAQRHVLEPERLHHQEQPQPLGQPDQAGEEAEHGQLADDQRPEHALLEAVVQVADHGAGTAARR